jgi:hypothetical protein
VFADSGGERQLQFDKAILFYAQLQELALSPTTQPARSKRCFLTRFMCARYPKSLVSKQPCVFVRLCDLNRCSLGLPLKRITTASRATIGGIDIISRDEFPNVVTGQLGLRDEVRIRSRAPGTPGLALCAQIRLHFVAADQLHLASFKIVITAVKCATHLVQLVNVTSHGVLHQLVRRPSGSIISLSSFT